MDQSQKVQDISPLSEAQAKSREFETGKVHESKDQNVTHTQNVRQIVEAILKCKMPTYEKDKFFRRRFPNFTESMPKLFEMIIRNDLTDQHHQYIEMMLNMSERLIDKREMEVLDADKIVYNKLREDYIDPVIKPDKEKIAEFMNKKEYSEEELNGNAPIKLDVR